LASRPETAIVAVFRESATMPIDPELIDYYTRVARELPAPPVLDVDARRARMETIARRFPAAPDAVARRDILLSLAGREIRARIYAATRAAQPAIVYFHGGGWVAGSIDTHDGACAALSRDAGGIVVSVDYRRPPEHPFPAPNDDAYAALDWVATHAAELGIDPARIAVGGDSAGAHLATCAALEARDRGRPALRAQLLIYPAIEPDFDCRSYGEHALTPSLTRDDMIWYWSQYLPHRTESVDARAIPTRASTLAGLPATHVVVAEFDPLHDEGLRYAGLLERAGVRVTREDEASLTHGFLRAAPYVPKARAAQRRIGVSTARLLA
jgi:acetyl esterase